VDKKGDTDRITLRVELEPGREAQREAIENELMDQLRLKTNLGYKLEFHDHGTLPRYEVKAKRFKDLRKGH
jgi:phenylacetate-CoA ligase